MMCKSAGSDTRPPWSSAAVSHAMGLNWQADTVAVCASLGIKCLEDRDKDKI